MNDQGQISHFYHVIIRSFIQKNSETYNRKNQFRTPPSTSS